MNPTESTDFSPVLLLETDLSRPLTDMHLVRPNSRKRYTRAQVLVRVYNSPIGQIYIERPSGEIDAGLLSQLIWKDLQLEINNYLKDNNLPLIDQMGTSALSEVNVPAYMRSREKLLQDAPFVSVVVTTRNRPDSLEVTLRSISAVKYPRFEIIIVDNAPSNDDTVKP